MFKIITLRYSKFIDRPVSREGKSGAGFTLIEILLTTAILLVVMGVSTTYLTSQYSSQYLRQAALDIRSSLVQARSLSAQGYDNKPQGVYFDKATRIFTIYSGDNYAARDASYDLSNFWNQQITISQPVASTFEINFTKLSGTTTPQTIILSAPDGSQETLIINQYGLVQ